MAILPSLRQSFTKNTIKTSKFAKSIAIKFVLVYNKQKLIYKETITNVVSTKLL